jgi:hypothetical protein
MAEAKRDQNRVTTLLGVDNVLFETPTTVAVDPITHAVIVSASIDTTGLATSAKQDTGNTSLSSIDGKITACNTGAVVLAAGTASIGKLAANSGVDIGDVDVTSVPRSLSGPGQPGTAVDSYTHAAISAAANTANQSLVAAPGANKQIWVYGISYVVGTAAGSVSFQDEDDTAISGVMPHALNSGMAVPPSGNFSMPIWKLATNKALEVDTVTCDIKGWLSFAIVSV